MIWSLCTYTRSRPSSPIRSTAPISKGSRMKSVRRYRPKTVPSHDAPIPPSPHHKAHQTSQKWRVQMDYEPPALFEREVKGFPGVATGEAGSGGPRFVYCRVEPGRLLVGNDRVGL